MYQLKQCVWEITLACCFSCKYCGSKGGRARENELTTAEALDVADQLGELGCSRVSMIGGEVFMRRDWVDICKRLRANGIAVNIITNGFLFAEKTIEDILSIGVESVSVSIDGPKDVHDKYRQEGSYERAVKALGTLCDAGIPTSVITTLNSENVKYLYELKDILSKYNIFAWQLQSCSPMGNAANNGIDYAYDQGSVMNFVYTNAETVPFAIGVADNVGYFLPIEGYVRGNRSGYASFKGCSAGISAIGIDSVGNVRGCESMYDEIFNEGNLREKSLREIWENPDGFAYNRKFTGECLTGACAECEMGEYCAGGCRSYNYFTHGKMYEAKYCARH